MRRLVYLSLLALVAGLLVPTNSLARPAQPKLEKISYPDLGKLVRSSKGKVVVVYFWYEW
jgi:hypothetical protein